MKQFVLICVAALVVSACGTSRNIVENNTAEHVRVRTFQIQHTNDTVYVPQRTQNRFHEVLANEFYRNAGFSYGDGITVRYRFVSLTQGNRAMRFLAGGIGNAGQASLVIESEFLDENGTVLATIQTEGRIDSGLLGGSYNSAMERAAEEITAYARENFYARYSY